MLCNIPNWVKGRASGARRSERDRHLHQTDRQAGRVHWIGGPVPNQPPPTPQSHSISQPASQREVVISSGLVESRTTLAHDEHQRMAGTRKEQQHYNQTSDTLKVNWIRVCELHHCELWLYLSWAVSGCHRWRRGVRWMDHIPTSLTEREWRWFGWITNSYLVFWINLLNWASLGEEVAEEKSYDQRTRRKVSNLFPVLKLQRNCLWESMNVKLRFPSLYEILSVARNDSVKEVQSSIWSDGTSPVTRGQVHFHNWPSKGRSSSR